MERERLILRRNAPTPIHYVILSRFTRKAVAKFQSQHEQAQKAPDLMKGFVNTVLGLPFDAARALARAADVAPPADGSPTWDLVARRLEQQLVARLQGVVR